MAERRDHGHLKLTPPVPPNPAFPQTLPQASLRSLDKIGYRYPRGESYFDILSRLDPLVHEMESYREPLLLVSHQAVMRLLYAFLMGKPRASAPKIESAHVASLAHCTR